MGHPQRRTFYQILKEFAPIGALIVLEKARLASAVAKCAVNLRSRRVAYAIKAELLKKAEELCAGKVDKSLDYRARRWRLHFRGWGEIHGGRL